MAAIQSGHLTQSEHTSRSADTYQRLERREMASKYGSVDDCYTVTSPNMLQNGATHCACEQAKKAITAAARQLIVSRAAVQSRQQRAAWAVRTLAGFSRASLQVRLPFPVIIVTSHGSALLQDT